MAYLSNEIIGSFIVAKNPNCPADMLIKLSSDVSSKVRLDVAKN